MPNLGAFFLNVKQALLYGVVWDRDHSRALPSASTAKLGIMAGCARTPANPIFLQESEWRPHDVFRMEGP
jgi:hypothetical protein